MSATNITRYFKSLVSVLNRTQGNAFEALLIDNDDGRFSFQSEALVPRLSLVANDDDLGYARRTLQSNAYVFDTWLKLSRGNFKNERDPDNPRDNPPRETVGYSDRAIPSEIDGFVYDPDTDTITNDIDSYSMVGFVSPEGFDQYVLDVTITSKSDWQSDPVGLIIGYARDDDGTTHTLSVFRTLYPDAYGYLRDALTVHVDLVTVGSELITGTNKGLDWLTGEPADGGQYTIPDGKTAYNVHVYNEFPNGVRIRVQRDGDVFTIQGSRLNDTELSEESTFSFNLDDYKSTRRFKGPSPYGFASLSQDAVTWTATQRPGYTPEVIDIRTNEKHVFENGEWVIEPLDNTLTITPGRLYYSDFNGKVFYRTKGGNITQLLG